MSAGSGTGTADPAADADAADAAAAAEAGGSGAAAAEDARERDSGDETDYYDEGELTLRSPAPEIPDATANEEWSDITKWGDNIEVWLWELLRFEPHCKLDPPHFAAGVIAKMYEPTQNLFPLPAAMLLVMRDVEAFDGGRFPDFKQFLDKQNRVVVEFETRCMTRPMTTDEKRWLSEATTTLLTALNSAGFHKDES